MELSFVNNSSQDFSPFGNRHTGYNPVDLNKELILNPASTFLVACNGDSMLNAFIPPKAHLIIDRSIKAHNGDIVLAHLNGDYLVRYLQKNEFTCKLIAANRKYHDITVTADMQLTIWGVVTHILTSTKDTNHLF